MDQPLPSAISLSEFLDWESRQAEHYEWVDGLVVPIAGVSDDHAAISANLTALIRPTLGADGPCFLRGSDRKLVPHNDRGAALGSFYADLFVSCFPDDRKGNAAHFPTLVIEILSEHENAEFTKKRDAYMGSAKIHEYIIVDSTRQYAIRYEWRQSDFLVSEYYRGPVPLNSLNIVLEFSDIYAGTTVPFVIHPIKADGVSLNG
jgi:Uma2 family endonuclease